MSRSRARRAPTTASPPWPRRSPTVSPPGRRPARTLTTWRCCSGARATPPTTSTPCASAASSASSRAARPSRRLPRLRSCACSCTRCRTRTPPTRGSSPCCRATCSAWTRRTSARSGPAGKRRSAPSASGGSTPASSSGAWLPASPRRRAYAGPMRCFPARSRGSAAGIWPTWSRPRSSSPAGCSASRAAARKGPRRPRTFSPPCATCASSGATWAWAPRAPARSSTCGSRWPRPTPPCSPAARATPCAS